MADAVAVLRAELPRKSVHLLAFLIPPASMLLGKTFVVLGLAAVTVVYAMSEYLRVRRARRTFISDAYSRLFRAYEQASNRIVVRPIYLAISVLACLLFFREDIAYAAIMLASLGDGLVRVERLLLERGVQVRRRVGSGVASFGLGFLAASFFVDPLVAFLAAVVAYFLEALPTRVDDNIAVPLGAALTILLLETRGIGSVVGSFVVGLDASAYWWLAETRLSTVYNLFLFLEFAVPFAFTALIILYALSRGWKAGAHLAAATAAIIVIGLVAKNLIGRPRPCVYFHGQGVPSCPLTDYSFPSLHAALGGTFLVYPIRLPRGHMVVWRIATVLLALSVALLGPYTGIHWASDVVGGFLLSTVLTFGTRRLHTGRPQASSPST